VKQILNDRGLTDGKIAFDRYVRFFIMDGIRKEASNFQMVGGDAIINGCRMFKTAHEIDLMKTASNITIAAYQYLHSKIEKGMSPRDVSGLMRQAISDLGGNGGGAMCLLNEASAYPHGSKQPQVVEEGGVVLLDGGTKIFGYSSDISRTFIYGEPTKRQRDVWNLMRDGQMLGFETAQLGTPCGEVDIAVRKFYEKNGFGPGYQAPGLTHRLGHGIGMDGHEPVNFVLNEKTLLQPGMCFSNEPGIYIYGEFGIRLEDCLYMTEKGPEWFSQPPTSLDNPMNI
jgi:Xaa-Pro dipeptidase